MPTPFPGMDPYLERPGLWSEVHTGLIAALQRFLTPLLRPRYRVAVERRTYIALLPPELAGIPDMSVALSDTESTSPGRSVTALGTMPRIVQLPMPEEVVERYLAVKDVGTGEVVTVIELLSPTNKLTGEGRKQYEEKRLKVLASLTNLVEVDLLRAGQPMTIIGDGDTIQSDYRIIVSRAEYRPNADAYLFSVREPIPDFPLPLRPHEDEPLVLLNQVLHTLYDEAGYDMAVDYSEPPVPPLQDEDAEWARELIRHIQSE